MKGLTIFAPSERRVHCSADLINERKKQTTNREKKKHFFVKEEQHGKSAMVVECTSVVIE